MRYTRLPERDFQESLSSEDARRSPPGLTAYVLSVGAQVIRPHCFAGSPDGFHAEDELSGQPGRTEIMLGIRESLLTTPLNYLVIKEHYLLEGDSPV